MQRVTERSGEKLLTVAEAMERLAISSSTIYRLFASGELPWVQIGADRRVREADLSEFIEKRTTTGGAA